MKALIVADGDVPSYERLVPALGPLEDWLIVCADGGALKAEALGLRPRVVVSDGDSLTGADLDRLQAGGSEIVRHVPHKDRSDTELALDEALARGAKTVRLIGALGGARPEHALANVLLLASPSLRGTDAAIVDGLTTMRVIDERAPIGLGGSPGDFVSLLPLTERVDGVTTSGLAYPLSGESLHQGPTRGLSNEMVATSATVSVASGRLLAVHTRRMADAT